MWGFFKKKKKKKTLKPPSWSEFLILDDGNKNPVGSFSRQLASCVVPSVGFLSVSPFHSLPFHKHSRARCIFPPPWVKSQRKLQSSKLFRHALWRLAQ